MLASSAASQNPHCPAGPRYIVCEVSQPAESLGESGRPQRGTSLHRRYSASNQRKPLVKKATPAGFEPEVEPNRFADLHNHPAKLGVPLGSGEIAWRHLRAVRLGPNWAPSVGSGPTGYQPAGVATAGGGPLPASSPSSIAVIDQHVCQGGASPRLEGSLERGRLRQGTHRELDDARDGVEDRSRFPDQHGARHDDDRMGWPGEHVHAMVCELVEKIAGIMAICANSDGSGWCFSSSPAGAAETRCRSVLPAAATAHASRGSPAT
jgi:hypothetical protein